MKFFYCVVLICWLKRCVDYEMEDIRGRPKNVLWKERADENFRSLQSNEEDAVI